jgi:crotonobetaine/carnitine-CoA ligase
MSSSVSNERASFESLGQALRSTAGRVPTKTFLRFADEGDVSFAEFDALADGLARGLAAAGTGQGDVVALMMPNCLDFVGCWLGLARLGAVTAAVNVALKGRGLAHVLTAGRSRLLVIDEEYVEQLAAVASEVPMLEAIFVRGDPTLASRLFPSKRVGALDELRGGEAVKEPEIMGRDLLMLLFTSGTTGVSKPCALSHRYALHQGELFADQFGLREDDVFYCPFPLFHADAAMYTVVPAILLGATAGLGRRFSVSRFWNEIRAFRATTFDYMGATLALLLKQPETPSDRDHLVRLAWGIPLPDWAASFSDRFGVALTTGYGLTEAGVLVYPPADAPLPAGAAGKPVYPYELRIVNEALRPVPPGKTGEILITAHEASVMSDGYYGMPEETAARFRGGWVHTGDLGSLDEDGFFYFKGRKKDALRRRGENISAFEIEETLDTFPAVLESAVCGVDSELTEQEVMAFIVPRPGHQIDPRALIAFCDERMAAYMVPRYIQIMASLPKTPTEKIAKSELMAIGITASTWDREAENA